MPEAADAAAARPLRIAYIGLGGNIDNPERRIKDALNALAALDEGKRFAASPLYLSRPLPSAVEQPDYLNACARLGTRLTAEKLWQRLQGIEQTYGRRRNRSVHWGPRALDLDLLLYGEAPTDGDSLKLPHPCLHERAFVLRPLFDIEPDLEVPGRGPVRELLARVEAAGDLRPWPL